MADAYTAEALAAQALIALTPPFDPLVFDANVFDSQSYSTRAHPVTGVLYSEIARRYVRDPADPFEVARGKGGQGTIYGDFGLYTDEAAQYGGHNP